MQDSGSKKDQADHFQIEDKENRMKKWGKLAAKIGLTFLLLLLFCLLVKKDRQDRGELAPEGEKIRTEDAVCLVRAFERKAALTEEQREALESWICEVQETSENKEFPVKGNDENEDAAKVAETSQEEGSFLTYGDYIALVSIWDQGRETNNMETGNTEEDSEKALDQKYREEDQILFQDFTEGYEKRLEAFQIQDQIMRVTLELLGNATDSSGNTYQHEKADVPEYCVAEAYVERNEEEDDRILVVTGRKKDSFTLKNVLITENNTDGFYFLSAGKERYCQGEDTEVFQEKIADITFAEGKVTGRKIKNEKKRGMLLGVTEEGIELKDSGFIPFAENYRVYRLYGSQQETDKAELKIGYDFADYVIEKGKICAVLLVKDQNMETIRVAINNQDFNGIYHEKISLKADCEMNLIYGNYKERQSRKIPAGEEITLDGDSSLMQGDRLMIEPAASSSRIQVTSLKRSYGNPSYRGRMEVVKKEQGLVLINELLLEEYLYSVVPSEMPVSYPEEALEAQAVCARTYAYRYLLKSGLPEEGAHVDDSVGFQVYNNIEENKNARKAVGETTGEMLFYDGAPIHAYYYSTSCGSGSDEKAFGSMEDLPYLNTRRISGEEMAETEKSATEKKETDRKGKNLSEESDFRTFLQEEHPEDYEKEEAWYRWQYEVQEIDMARMAEGMKESFSKIYDISVTERLESGLATVLLLKTDTGDYEVKGEYQIRKVLSQGGDVIRADGSAVTNGSLLPSAYLIISVEKNRESVIGYTILGGGYGHGVGMSQNGAADMARAGSKKEDILSFFYEGADLIKMY